MAGSRPADGHSNAGACGMNEWGEVFLVYYLIPLFSMPFILFALLMRLVGRIGNRALIDILAADSGLWAAATYFWWMRACD